jgi:hypothetical protein
VKKPTRPTQLNLWMLRYVQKLAINIFFLIKPSRTSFIYMQLSMSDCYLHFYFSNLDIIILYASISRQDNKQNGNKENNSEIKKEEGSKPKKKKHAVKTNDLPIESGVPSLSKKLLNLAVEKEVRFNAVMHTL